MTPFHFSKSMNRLRFLIVSTLVFLGTFIPWRRKYKVTDEPSFGYTEITYTLKTKDGKWQWRTDDGADMSPVFDSKKAAMAYGTLGQCTFSTTSA